MASMMAVAASRMPGGPSHSPSAVRAPWSVPVVVRQALAQSSARLHAQLLRRFIRDCLGDPAGFAQAWDEGTERLVAPFYCNQISADRARLAEMTASAKAMSGLRRTR
jgi:hypothetical protein